MIDKEKSTLQEYLVMLYLRLNGYFTTGYIIHSNEKKIDGEIDILAVRFPFHKQDYTGHNSSKFLEIPLHIDIIIAEVKSKGQPLQFNGCLKQKVTIEPWIKILSWTGIFKDEDLATVALELNELVQPKENSQLKALRSTMVIKTSFGNLTIRPILFSPEKFENNTADKFINWSELNNFIWECLCPSKIRDLCGIQYDFTAWGQGLNEIVKVYKDRQKAQNKFKTIEELYIDIENKRDKKFVPTCP
jgi:hypothetical protein